MTDEEERADPSAVECKFAYTDLCSLQIQWGLDLQMNRVGWRCNALYLLWMIERLKWEESHANAADHGDRVESVYTRVYSISNRWSICVHFLKVHLLLLPVNHACETCKPCKAE